MDPKFPSIAVELSNTDGNAYMIMGAMLRALRRAEVDEHTITEFCTEATAGDYDHLLQTCSKWVNVE